jgi:hypothetical protein
VLSGVSCTARNACIAVGSYVSRSGNGSTLAEVWNGRSWSIQPTPNQPGSNGSALRGVSCTSASACTAVGATGVFTLAERWDGTSWTIQPTPGALTLIPRLSAGVSCTSARGCTAVWSTRSRTTAANWYGNSWVLQRTASPAGAFRHTLGSVSCVPSGGCTAVGAYQKPEFVPFTLAEARS